MLRKAAPAPHPIAAAILYAAFLSARYGLQGLSVRACFSVAVMAVKSGVEASTKRLGRKEQKERRPEFASHATHRQILVQAYSELTHPYITSSGLVVCTQASARIGHLPQGVKEGEPCRTVHSLPGQGCTQPLIEPPDPLLPHHLGHCRHH